MSRRLSADVACPPKFFFKMRRLKLVTRRRGWRTPGASLTGPEWRRGRKPVACRFFSSASALNSRSLESRFLARPRIKSDCPDRRTTGSTRLHLIVGLPAIRASATNPSSNLSPVQACLQPQTPEAIPCLAGQFRLLTHVREV